jgi:c-di-AMP phosphodiesterase-like protein
MCGYDPFYWYEKQLDEEAEMTELGFDNYDDYLDYLQDEKESKIISMNEER